MKHEPQQFTAKASHRTLVVVLLLIFVPFAIFIIYQAIMYANPYLRINFTTYVPANKQIENQELSIDTYMMRLTGGPIERIDTVIRPKVWILYDIKGTGIHVTLQKSSRSHEACQKDTKNDISTSHCTIKKTPKGHVYRYNTFEQLSDGIYDGDEGASVDLDDTQIELSLTVHSVDQLHKTDWSALIDSFQPINFNSSSLPVHRRQWNFQG